MEIGKVRSLIEPIVSALGVQLVDVRSLTEHGRSVLRVMVDREGGVTVGDCSSVSREIETLLDVEESIRGRYDLEVSSPGLDRPLVTEADFVRYTGKVASIKTQESIEGRRNYKGALQGVVEGNIVMTIDGKEFRIPVGFVEKAHLVWGS